MSQQQRQDRSAWYCPTKWKNIKALAFLKCFYIEENMRTSSSTRLLSSTTFSFTHLMIFSTLIYESVPHLTEIWYTLLSSKRFHMPKKHVLNVTSIFSELLLGTNQGHVNLVASPSCLRFVPMFSSLAFSLRCLKFLH